MSVIVKGMEMPKHCIDCPLMVDRFDTDACALQSQEANEAFESWEDMRRGCPLVPLPEGHGRLVDAERFRVILCRLKERQNDDVAIHALNWAIECLDKLDTIVPAEGGKADDSKL